MAITTLGETGGRQAVGRGVQRHALVRLLAVREHPARRRLNTRLLGLDDATLATYGNARTALDELAGRAFPL